MKYNESENENERESHETLEQKETENPTSAQRMIHVVQVLHGASLL